MTDVMGRDGEDAWSVYTSECGHDVYKYSELESWEYESMSLKANR
jgi:hypothetical protein